MNKYDSIEYWNKFVAQFRNSPHGADLMVEAIYLARGTLPRNTQHLLDDLINALYPHTFFAETSHHIFWMYLRGILHPDHHPICIATRDTCWEHWGTPAEPPQQPNHLQQIATELAAIRKELEQLKMALPNKRNPALKAEIARGRRHSQSDP